MGSIMSEEIKAILAGIAPLIAIVVIGCLVYNALEMGHDGMGFVAGVASIAGLGGYEVKEWIYRRRSTTTKDDEGK